MAEGGQLNIIDGSSDSDHDDREDNTQKVSKGVKIPIWKKHTTFSYKDVKAKLLVKFVEDFSDVKKKVKVETTPNKVSLSCENQTLLATEKQKLDKILQGIKDEKVDWGSCVGETEIQTICKREDFKNVLFVPEKLHASFFARDESLIEEIIREIKRNNEKSTETPNKAKETKITNRRNRIFSDSSGAPIQKTQSEESCENYKSPLPWQRQASTEGQISSDKQRESSQPYPITDLGKDIETKLDITLKSGLKLKIYKGSIVHAKVDAIVNAANERLENVGGVALAIAKSAGCEMEKECKRKMKKYPNGIKLTENIVTMAGRLPCKHVIHAVGPRWELYDQKKQIKCLENLSLTVTNILHRACEYNLKSVVMPPISSGIFGVPKHACASMYIRAIQDFEENVLLGNHFKLRQFNIVDVNDEMLDLVVKAYHDRHKTGVECLEPQNVLNSLLKPSAGRFGKSDSTDILLNRDKTSTYRTVRGKQNNDVQVRETKENECRCESSKNGFYTFILNGKLKVHIYHGDITEVKNVKIIVSSEDVSVSGQGFLARNILQKAGKCYQQKHRTLCPTIKPPKLSDILQSPAGKLKFDLVFHAVMKKFPDKLPSSDNLSLLWTTTLNILKEANEKKGKKKKKKEVSVAMPLLGTGSIKNRENIKQYAQVVFSCILDFSKTKELRVKEIHLVNFSKDTTDVIKDIFANPTKGNLFSYENLTPLSYPTSPKQKEGTYYQAVKFDPKLYTKVEEWKVRKVKEMNIDQYIEPLRIQKKSYLEIQDTKNENKGKEDTESTKKGNVTLIGSDDDESENEDGHAQSKIGATAPDLNSNHSDNDYVSDPEESSTKESDDPVSSCVICMDDEMEEPVKLRKCQHEFCRECLTEYFSHKRACPVCNTVYGDMYGNQPEDGVATVYRDKESLPGYTGHRTLIIHYRFQDGTQSDEHPHPGISYTGLSRQAYLPDNVKGQKVLVMLRKAFEQRLTFTVGFSRTSGRDDVVTWNDIHHKTRRDGGPEKYGYPDSQYLDRVMEELKSKGIFHQD